MRTMALVAAATIGLLGSSAQADPLGLFAITATGPGTTSCASPTLPVSGAVSIASAAPGASTLVNVSVDGTQVASTRADVDGTYEVTVTDLTPGDHVVVATVNLGTPLATESAPLVVTSTGAPHWIDEDGDGFGSNGHYEPDPQDPANTIFVPSEAVCYDETPLGWSSESGDCDDADRKIHPGAVEADGDGIDSDCNGRDN